MANKKPHYHGTSILDEPCYSNCPHLIVTCKPQELSWEEEFVKMFFVYNLKESSPAGAEKQVIQFIRNLISSERQAVKEELRKEVATRKTLMNKPDDHERFNDNELEEIYHYRKAWNEALDKVLSILE